MNNSVDNSDVSIFRETRPCALVVIAKLDLCEVPDGVL